MTTDAPRVKRPVIRYHGGKFRLALWIISHLPPHRIYVEPFCGAASVLMAKERSYAEVINDMDGNIVNLFQVLRSPSLAMDLEQMLRLTPFARAEFELAYEEVDKTIMVVERDPNAEEGEIDPFRQGFVQCPVEMARRMIVRSFMGFGSAAHNVKHRTGFRSNTTRTHTTPAHDWANYPQYLKAMTERLQGVVIENKAAIDVIQRFDGHDTLFYVDPPYVHSTRQKVSGKTDVYVHEMTDADHRALADCLRNVAGMVVLSGYRCPLYDEMYGDWQRVSKAALADGAAKREEYLWINPAAQRAMRQLSFEEAMA